MSVAADLSRPYGDLTAEEARTIGAGRCVLPCNTAVCPIFGSREMIESDGAMLRPDGRRAFCGGCADDRHVPCARRACQAQCHVCHAPYRVKDSRRALADAVPAVCGQKHAFPLVALEELGGLESEDCDIPWIPPRRLPHDRFVVGIQRNRSWVAAAAAEIPHRSWMASAKGLWPRPPRDLRDAFGIPEDHFFALTFRVKDRYLEDLWLEHRQSFFDWLARQRLDAVMMVNFSPWGDLPRFNAFLMMKRMFICYREMTERGIPTVYEYDTALPWYLDLYLDRFRERNGIAAFHSSFQVGRLDEVIIARTRRVAANWPVGAPVFATGASDPATAAIHARLFARQDVYFGNVDVYVRAGHWKLPPGLLVSRKKMNSREIFCEGIRRWQYWTARLVKEEAA